MVSPLTKLEGAVKGNPEVMLEQSATMADKVSVTFSDGDMQVPGGFYEFAKRYLQPDGEIYTGFFEASADKIFEGTYHSLVCVESLIKKQPFGCFF